MEASKFIGALMQSRDAMHLAHWKTTNYAEHKALGAYYEGIIELVDDFVEAYFGYTKRVPIEIPATKVMEPMSHLKELCEMIEMERPNYSPDLQNIMDEMAGLVHKTMYLLTLV